MLVLHVINIRISCRFLALDFDNRDRLAYFRFCLSLDSLTYLMSDKLASK